ncbi:unnamed protein product [Diabrotica balteata]|uniref:protein-histidine N-methyltransferase n=1 Tax=Diabrotica balteata TaxID=107213 RepID=A0A9N9T8R7_DIABA|nr:unnamed protein product [Diabrotica balteata]
MGRKGANYRPKHFSASKNQKGISELIDKLLRISTIIQQKDVSKSLEHQKEISTVLDKLKKIQSNNDSVISSNRSSDAIIDKFSKWCKSNGAEFNGCNIESIEGFDLGLIANTEIPVSSLVISVPRKLILTVEIARKSELKTLLEKDPLLSSMTNVALAIFLLYEKFKSESFWKPYLDILPSTYTTVLYFTVEELEELKGSPTLDLALHQMKSIARQYAYFYKLFHASSDPVCVLMRDKFTFEEYRWAVSTVMTRQNTIPSECHEGTVNALIPLWDMCNHINGTISTDYNPDLQRCECLALKDYQPGEQFFIFYGARTNADFFIHNGFVYENNEHDGYWIKLGISKSDPLQEKRVELLNKLNIQPTSNFFIKKGPLPIDGSLLAFVRIFNMNEEQLRHWLDNDRSDDVQYLECALDTSLEKKSWIFLQARLKLLLGIYKTTLDGDLKLLENKELSANRRLAIKMRATEKMVLVNAIEYVEQYIKQ